MNDDYAEMQKQLRYSVDRISANRLYEETGEYSVSALRMHGCDVEVYPDRCVIVFPTGTVQEEKLPRIRNSRFIIILPDGFQIEGVMSRETGLYTLRFPINILPKHLQEQYEKK